ncbi:hypothetical protein ACTHGU_18155 [Chitinophagaceae bacterium MMS25-I14]
MEQTPGVPQLSIGQSLDKAWADLKNNIVLFAAFTLLYCIVSGIIGIIPVIGLLNNLFGFILSASIFNAYRTVQTTGKLDFNDFLSWSPRFGRLLVGYLLQLLIFCIFIVPFVLIIASVVGVNAMTMRAHNIEEVREMAGMFSAGMIIIMALAMFIISVILGIILFAYGYLVQFTDHSYTDCLKMSWNIGKNNIGSIIVFCLLAMGISIIGTLLCCIGLLAAIPLIMGIQYYFLDSMFPKKDKIQEWDFMQQMPPGE